MRKQISMIILLLSLCVSIFSTDPVGQWNFDNSLYLIGATVGNDLELVGTQTATDGPDENDGAVTIGAGSYYECFHDIAANGGSTEWVNDFTIVIDVKIPQLNQWYCFYQTSYTNSNDGDWFIRPNGTIGVGDTGYSNLSIDSNEWYRLAISVSLGNHYDYYLDGQLLHEGGAQSFDGRFAIYSSENENTVLFFADNNGEDNEFDIAKISLYDTDLSATEIAELGGYGHEIESPGVTSMIPYLQTPTDNSIYINWHENNSTESIVQYGTTEDLNQTQSGDYYEFDDGRIWHNVHLSDLLADTKYYYKCVSDTANSVVKTFRTQPNSGSGHVRFAVYGDTRTDIAKHSEVILALKETVEEVYEEPLEDYLNLVLNVGDIVTTGSNLSQYDDEYFTPIAPISGNVPFMVSIGNHEAEAQYYYDYMKYEDFDGVEGEIYYSFEIQSILFIALNSNTQGNIQMNWLEDELEDAQEDDDISMIFILLHHPGRSELWPDGNTTWVQNEVIPMLAQFDKAEFLFYGHSHNYERGVWDTGNLRLLLAGGGGSALDRWGMYANQEDYHEIHRAHDYYGYTIFDIDLDNNSYVADSYSLGHLDLPADNVVFDSFSRYKNMNPPQTPIALSPNGISSNVLVASPFTSDAGITSSHFQITNTEDSWENPILDEIRLWENVYGDSGSPNYIPIDLNDAIDLTRIGTGNLQAGNTYWWRIQYRDQNLKRSEWSEPAEFTFGEIIDNADFAVDHTNLELSTPVRFTDISVGNVTNREWDFDNNGTIDSYEMDPEFIYNEVGVFSVMLTATIDGEEYTELKQDYITIIPSDTDNDGLELANLQLKNYPNPFNPATTISFNLPNNSEKTSLIIYNIKGQKVKTFPISSNIESGNIEWNGTNEGGDLVSSGIYFYKILNSKFSIMNKMILLK
ncbi:MAG: fibronectin type III domain-containing protein [Candidatus Cloacimonadota bacterium]|nr:fibronectin type III domain-containing protein [Candidatus Cloacimonadota bacterium]